MADPKKESSKKDAASPQDRPEGREVRLRDIAKRLFREEAEEGEPVSDEERRLRTDLRDAVVQVISTGDKAKTEMVRMVAREARTYLEALKIKEDLQDLLTNYSLEVNASFHLKPLPDSAKGTEE